MKNKTKALILTILFLIIATSLTYYYEEAFLLSIVILMTFIAIYLMVLFIIEISN
jgi:hypothetical protein